MANASTIPATSALFPYAKWNTHLRTLADTYQKNRPFPHIQLEEFLDPEIALAIAKEFPAAGTDAWTQYKHHNENKLGMAKRELFPPKLGVVADELNSPEFVSWLSKLTGIPHLHADASLEGGGLHQSGRGGFLNVHTDFSMHHYHKNWRRRVNVIVYLNPGWKEEWGGAIEFWEKGEKGVKACAAKYAPLLNRAVIFTTDDRSLHGFPDPLSCPEGESRKSLAFYYYTQEENAHVAAHSTDYYSRPQDGMKEKALIWLDKKAVDLYSRAKARLGFSDEFASKILGFLSGKK
jgi:Rps23 Pro-64 3,4-dihydroxylase Tpa1-like proline 4-hydroxylase